MENKKIMMTLLEKTNIDEYIPLKELDLINNFPSDKYTFASNRLDFLEVKVSKKSGKSILKFENKKNSQNQIEIVSDIKLQSIEIYSKNSKWQNQSGLVMHQIGDSINVESCYGDEFQIKESVKINMPAQPGQE